MIDLEVQEDMIIYSKDLVNKKNYGQRGIHDGNKRKQFIGVLSENMVRSFLKKDLMKMDDNDYGYDIDYYDYKADIKAMERKIKPKQDHVNNILDIQMNHQADAFIFTSLNVKKKILTICGWIPKKEFKKKAQFFVEGTERKRDDGSSFKSFADLWELENKYLYPIL